MKPFNNRDQLILLLAAPLIVTATCAHAVGKVVREFPGEFIKRWKELGKRNSNL